MINRRTVIAACGAAGVAALLLTAGCSAGSADGAGSGTPTASAGMPSSGPTAGDAAPTGDPSQPGTTPGAGTTPEPGTTRGPDAAANTPVRSEQRVRRCLTPNLTGRLEPVEGGGSAGHYALAIVLTNQADAPCVLQGWPGVSFVGDGDGSQIGAAATLDRTSPHGTVTLEPGSAAQAVVQVANADNYGTECGQTQADGFRVYPPGEKRSLFVQGDQITLTACSDADQELLDVQAFRPAG